MSESYYNRLIVQVVAIINPISGAGADTRAAEHRIALLTAELDRRHLRAAMHLTRHAGHAHALATEAVSHGARLVIVWGGDGTINEAGAALLGTDVRLGVVPAGSGNGLAAALQCAREPRAAIAAALDGTPRAIDAGFMAARPFFNIAGIGVDARIATRFNLRAKGSRGRWPYILIGMREGWHYRATKYDLELDGEPCTVRALVIAFANGGEYGNGVRLTTLAELDDGLLDATVIEDRPVVTRFWHARHLVRGTAAGAPGVLSRKIRRAVVRTSGPMEYHVDGEPASSEGPIEVTIRPRALLVNVR